MRRRAARMLPSGLGLLGILGPGLALAAAGVGAGDVTMAALGGARFSVALIWVPLVAALLKYTLNEGLARWQLATGETLLEGWGSRLGPIVTYGFLIYLIVWTIPVFAALISTTGVVMNLLVSLDGTSPRLAGPLFDGGPDRAPLVWSMFLLMFSFLLLWFGKYRVFEAVMTAMTIVMVAVVLTCACLLFPERAIWIRSWNENGWWPWGANAVIFSILGGTGSTVGVMSYAYWIKERGREGARWLGVIRLDLGCSYLLSALFGVGIMILAGGISEWEIARILNLPGETVRDQPKLADVFRIVAFRMEHELGFGPSFGLLAGTAFKLALVATVTSSLLGMLQSVPYFYQDILGVLRGRSNRATSAHSSYWWLMFTSALVPLPLVFWRQPVQILMIYAIWGSLFMPFLALTLLLMNTRRRWMGDLVNGWLANAVLVACLALFSWGAWDTVSRMVLSEKSQRPLVGVVPSNAWK